MRTLQNVVALLAAMLIGLAVGLRIGLEARDQALAVAKRANAVSNDALADAETYRHVAEIALARCRGTHPRPPGFPEEGR